MVKIEQHKNIPDSYESGIFLIDCFTEQSHIAGRGH